MRLFRKCAQEDVNNGIQRHNLETLVDKYQLLASHLAKSQSNSIINNLQNESHVEYQNVYFRHREIEKSPHDFCKDEIALHPVAAINLPHRKTTSSSHHSTMQSQHRQSKFQKQLKNFIVPRPRCSRLLKLLSVIINFIYSVLLNPLISIRLGYKSFPFVDSRFIVNQNTISTGHQNTNNLSVIDGFITNSVEIRKCCIQRVNDHCEISRSSVNCGGNCKRIACKNQNVKILEDREFHVNSNFTTSSLFSLLSTNRNVHAIRRVLKKVGSHLPRGFGMIDFYSSFNLCDKFVNFLKFYNNPARLKSAASSTSSPPSKELLIKTGIAEAKSSGVFRLPFKVKWHQSKLSQVSIELVKLIRRILSLEKFGEFSKPCRKRTSEIGWTVFSSYVVHLTKWLWTSSRQLLLKRYHQKCCQHHHLKRSVQREHCRQPNDQFSDSKRCEFHGIFGIPLRTIRSIFLIAFITSVPHISASFHHNIKYSVNVVKTKYGPLRGVVVRSNPTVEAFLGVPYASPPVGSLRYMPPVTPSTWRTTRLADRFSPVCPQVAPVAPSGPEALLEVPRGRLAQLRRLLPLLANQSEDCLYLNLYVPRTIYPTPPSGTTSFGGDVGATGPGLGAFDGNAGTHNIPNDAPDDKPLPAILYIHGESYEWNSGNPYDGSVLAAHGNVIVVTINFRLGVLGFLKTGGKGSAQGNFGLMDLVAGLHWLRENLPAFGGDPNKVTVMGHGTGAALANMLIVSPVASDLVHRGILISGSALSPWAIQSDPLFVKRRVAEQTGCHGDMLVDDLAPCLRSKTVAELLTVKVDSPRFLPGFAPFIDGTVIVHPSGGAAGPLTLPAGSAIASTSGIELADFPNRELIFGLTTIESYLDLSAQDLEFGFNETRRDRILRTYVRNIYHYHLNEIYAALKNEYTDWEKPVRNPMGSRDASLEFLSDGHTAGPLIRLGYLHSLRGGRSYFLHFRHQSGERDYPQRGGSVRGEDVPFCLGLPISPLFPHNYTKQDIKISRILIRYLTNFALTGNPNENPTASVDISHVIHSSKGALVSSSLTLASASPASLPPSMSLVAVPSLASGSAATLSTSLSSLSSSTSISSLSAQSRGDNLHATISVHQFSHQPPSPSSSSISTSSVPLSLSASSSPAVSAEPLFAQQHESLSSSSSSLSSASSSTSSSSTSGIVGETKASSIFVAPPMHTVIKSKRHSVAAHRRKRKTSKRMSNQHQKRIAALSKKTNNNYRKKFLAGNGANANFGAESSSSSSSSMSFQADEQASRHLKETGRSIDRRNEDSTEQEDDDEDEEEEENEGNSDEDHRNNLDDDDDGTTNAGNNHNEDDDDEYNNSQNRNSADTDENSSNNNNNNVEKFDRFDNFNIPRLPFWDTYDAINQLYLELGNKMEVKNHYRGHKLSMWLSLIPQLHSPGDLSELPMRHHHFMEDSAQYYDGIIRPQIMQRPSFPKAPVQQLPGRGGGGGAGQAAAAAIPITTSTPSVGRTTATTTVNPKTDHPGFNVGIPATTECPPNTTVVPTIAATRPQNYQQNVAGNSGAGTGSNNEASGNKQDSNNNLLRRLASSQFQSYTTALTVTIAVGCFLLLLNILIFAGIYYQREKRATDTKKKELLREAENLCSSSTNLEKLTAEGFSGTGTGGTGKGSRKSSLQSVTTNFGEYSCYDEKIQCKEKHSLADICSVELPLKEFKCSGSSPAPSHTGSLTRQHQSAASSNPSSSSSSGNVLAYPPSYHHHPQTATQQHHRIHHHYSAEHQQQQQQGCSDNDLVTYQQFQKQSGSQHYQRLSHQQRQQHGATSGGGGGISSASIGISTEQCNQSTQSEQPTVQDVATSIDEKSVVAVTSSLGCGSSGGGGDSSSCGGSSSTGAASTSRSGGYESNNMISPGIPEPPPPPKSSVPYQGGILRQPGPPTTPGSNKKRVQIQEISV